MQVGEQVAGGDQSALAQSEIIETMKRLVREGFDWRCVLTGADGAIVTMLVEVAGPQAVAPHFSRMAKLAAEKIG